MTLHYDLMTFPCVAAPDDVPAKNSDSKLVPASTRTARRLADRFPGSEEVPIDRDAVVIGPVADFDKLPVLAQLIRLNADNLGELNKLRAEINSLNAPYGSNSDMGLGYVSALLREKVRLRRSPATCSTRRTRPAFISATKTTQSAPSAVRSTRRCCGSSRPRTSNARRLSLTSIITWNERACSRN